MRETTKTPPKPPKAPVKQPPKGGPGIPTAPSGPRGGSSSPGPTRGPSSSLNGGSASSGPKKPPAKQPPKKGGKGKGGGGGGGYDPQKEADKARNRAGTRALDQAANLQGQANALLHGLRIDLRKGLDQQLSDIDELMKEQDRLLLSDYKERVGSLGGAAGDNDKSAAAESTTASNNMLRERNSAVAEAMGMGAGESDILNTQMMSLRNWNANQNEVQRGYFDTLRSINSSLSDLTIDTRTARVNNEVQGNADKEQLWTNFYNQQSELYTQLGNTYGQQADLFAEAKEYGKKGAGGGGNGGGGTSKLGDVKNVPESQLPPRYQSGTPNKPGNSGPTKQPPKKGTSVLSAVKTSQAPSKPAPAKPPLPAPGPVRQPPIVPKKATTTGPTKAPQAQTARGTSVLSNVKPGGPPKPGSSVLSNVKHKSGPIKLGPAKPPKVGQGLPAGPKYGDLTPDNMNEATQNSGAAFMDASEVLGKSWNNPGISDALLKWKGADDFKGGVNNYNRLGSAPGFEKIKRPEGATLRKW